MPSISKASQSNFLCSSGERNSSLPIKCIERLCNARNSYSNVFKSNSFPDQLIKWPQGWAGSMKGELAFPTTEQYLPYYNLPLCVVSGSGPHYSTNFPSLPSQATEYAPSHPRPINTITSWLLPDPMQSPGCTWEKPRGPWSDQWSFPCGCPIRNPSRNLLKDPKPAHDKEEPPFPRGRRGGKGKQSLLIRSAFEISKGRS